MYISIFQYTQIKEFLKRCRLHFDMDNDYLV
jgi:hypothetical protein